MRSDSQGIMGNPCEASNIFPAEHCSNLCECLGDSDLFVSRPSYSARQMFNAASEVCRQTNEALSTENHLVQDHMIALLGLSRGRARSGSSPVLCQLKPAKMSDRHLPGVQNCTIWSPDIFIGSIMADIRVLFVPKVKKPGDTGSSIRVTKGLKKDPWSKLAAIRMLLHVSCVD